MALKNLWICPKCGRRFVNRNQSHSCGHYTIKQHLKGKSPHVIALYKRFLELVMQCGSVILAPTKTRIGFQVRMIFAAVSLKQGGLNCHVVLSRVLKNPRFTRIESISPQNNVHHFRIQSMDELDDEAHAWLKEAYQIGEQKRLTP